jgi:hypothetical protein
MMNEAMKKATGPEALDDDLLDGVAGGLVQLVNPSSGSYHYFLDGTVCQHCGCPRGSYKRKLKRMQCLSCDERMVDRKVYADEIGETDPTGLL